LGRDRGKIRNGEFFQRQAAKDAKVKPVKNGDAGSETNLRNKETRGPRTVTGAVCAVA
jgi:hypothetical protein